MPRDHRLSHLDETINDVAAFFRRGDNSKIDYHTSFAAKARYGEPPFNTNRFESRDLQREIVNQKLVFNPGLGYVSSFEDPTKFEVFLGLGRFNRKEEYSFKEGKALTPMNFTQSPAYNPTWDELYKLSPTIPAEDKVSNPMPRITNPDPKGNLMASAQKRAENEVEDNKSVAQLLDKKGKDGKDDKPKRKLRDVPKKKTSEKDLKWNKKITPKLTGPI